MRIQALRAHELELRRRPLGENFWPSDRSLDVPDKRWVLAWTLCSFGRIRIDCQACACRYAPVYAARSVLWNSERLMTSVDGVLRILFFLQQSRKWLKFERHPPTSSHEVPQGQKWNCDWTLIRMKRSFFCQYKYIYLYKYKHSLLLIHTRTPYLYI
jgi:hypothetical protein